MKTGKLVLEARRERVRKLVKKSRERLVPFGEPLNLDLALNRWLARGREEAWSDWFAWFFEQLKVGELAHLFGIENWIAGNDREKQVEGVRREYWVKSGNKDATGRLDLFIRLPGGKAVVVEVKLVITDDADTKKQEGYFSSMEGKGWDCKYFLIEPASSVKKKYRFDVLPYEEFCLRVRHWIEGSAKDNHEHTFLALGLALVGAIESCLLGFSVAGDLASDATIKHLSSFLETRHE